MKWKTVLGNFMDGFNLPKRIRMLERQNRFMLFELRRINEAFRSHLLDNRSLGEPDKLQTGQSFDYQWAEYSTGVAMPDDPEFMSQIQSQICRMTDLPADWFKGRRVVDIGCGAGRFTYGMLSMGAIVTACDQSDAGLSQTAKLCAGYSDRLALKKVDLLQWDEVGDFDLGFCFGVVHHTGNAYGAIKNAALKVKSGGRVFLMVYGFPETPNDFEELISYEEVRQKIRNLALEEKKAYLIEQYGPYYAHGWFDAVSPRINDLLTFEEIADFLTSQGFANIKRTMIGRNHHLVGDKIST